MSKEYSLIVVIVDVNQNELVMSLARKAGATGGTIIRGKGTSIYEKRSFWGIEINPNKDVVLIISPQERAQKIVEKINSTMELEKPTNGIAFIIPLSGVIGLNDYD